MVSTSLKEYFSHMKNLLADTKDDRELFDLTVNAPFHDKLHTTNLDLGIVELLLVSKRGNTINRIALSDTDPARWASKMTPIPFKEIKIPRNHRQNTIARVIRNEKYQSTTDWKYLFMPILSAEAARFNQAGAGIACSYVYPLIDARDGGALIFSFYQSPDNIRAKHRQFMQEYSDLVAESLKVQ